MHLYRGRLPNKGDEVDRRIRISFLEEIINNDKRIVLLKTLENDVSRFVTGCVHDAIFL
jgi:hypothetical protein